MQVLEPVDDPDIAVGIHHAEVAGSEPAVVGQAAVSAGRYSGASLAYQLAAITVSGGTPFVMTALIAQTGTTTLVAVFVAVFVALMGVVTFFSAWTLREANPAEVRSDPDAIPGAQLYR